MRPQLLQRPPRITPARAALVAVCALAVLLVGVLFYRPEQAAPAPPADQLLHIPSAHLVTWNDTCATADARYDCCMEEWKRHAEPGDREVQVSVARAGAVEFQAATYATGDIVSSSIISTRQWEPAVTAALLGALDAAAQTAGGTGGDVAPVELVRAVPAWLADRLPNGAR